MKKLELSRTEREQIGSIARYNKPQSTGNSTENLYTKDIFKKLSVISDSYSLLLNLSNNFEISNEIRGRIKSYLLQFKEIIEKIYHFLNIDRTIDYGFNEFKDDIANFLICNDELVNNLVYEAFLMGRVIKKYNPETTTGYY